MGCGWTKNSGLENRKQSVTQNKTNQRLITQNENSAPPIIEVEVSTNSGKENTGKSVTNKTKKKRKEKKILKEERYNLKINDFGNPDFTPLWTNKNKIGAEFPIYKFLLEKSPHEVSDEKWSK